MLIYLYVALGGALGSVARFAASGVVANLWGGTFPWGTMFVNVTGSFIIGVFASLTDPQDGRWLVGTDKRQFFMTGICGGYTTFSSFSLNTLNLVRGGDMLQAGGNVLASVTLCLVAVWLGYALGMAINLKKGS